MTNLLLYIRALQRINTTQLLRNAWVENDTVYVLENDYEEAKNDFRNPYGISAMQIIDAIIHNKFKCQYFKFGDMTYSNTYYWDEDTGIYTFDERSFLS